MEQLKTVDGTGWEINKSGIATDPNVDGDWWCDHCFVALEDHGEEILGGQLYSKRVCPGPYGHHKLIWLAVAEQA